MEYDAIRDCAGADAWTCLARTVEEVSYHRKVAFGDDEDGGRDGGDFFDELPEEEPLELTLMRYKFCLCINDPALFGARI